MLSNFHHQKHLVFHLELQFFPNQHILVKSILCFHKIIYRNQIGLLEHSAESFFKSQPTDSTLTDEMIAQLIEERKSARAEKNFARSDEIRDLLAEQGIELLDNSEGTTWRRG